MKKEFYYVSVLYPECVLKLPYIYIMKMDMCLIIQCGYVILPVSKMAARPPTGNVKWKKLGVHSATYWLNLVQEASV